MKNKFYLSLMAAGISTIGLAQGIDALDCDWARGFQPTTATSTGTGNCITATSTHVYSAGTIKGTLDYGAGTGFYTPFSSSGAALTDMYITCQTVGGLHSWTKVITGTAVEQPQRIIFHDQHIYVVGYFSGTCDFDPSASTANSTASGTSDIFLAKYTSAGAFVWRRVMGGTGADKGFGLTVDGVGDLVICGDFSGTADFDPSTSTSNLVASGAGTDAFFAKYTSTTGSLIFTKQIGLGSTASESASNVRIGLSNDIIVGGNHGSASCDFDPNVGTAFQPHYGSSDGFVAKYSSTGVYSWATVFGTGAGDAVNDIAIDNNGEVYLIGNFGSLGAGTMTSSTPAGIAVTNAGGASTTDIVLAQLSGGTGIPGWDQSFGGTDRESGLGIEFNSTGHIYITCIFSSASVDFDYIGATGVSNNAGLPGTYDLVYARYRLVGDFMDASRVGGPENDQCNEIWVQSSINKLYATGSFRGTTTIDFDPDAINVDNLTGTFGSVNIPFTAKYDFTLVPAMILSNNELAQEQEIEEPSALGFDDEMMASSTLSVYPNPSNNELYIDQVKTGSTIQLYSLDGNLNGTWVATTDGQMQLDIADLSSGLYLIRVTNTDGLIQTAKISKQ